jgi:hypothetical protein
MHAALGNIPGDPMLPDRLKALERERFEFHTL